MTRNIEYKFPDLRHVVFISDDDGHQFCLPYKMAEEFNADLSNEAFVDSGGFSEKYDKYMLSSAGIDALIVYVDVSHLNW